jgi:hypothetical protein
MTTEWNEFEVTERKITMDEVGATRQNVDGQSADRQNVDFQNVTIKMLKSLIDVS